MDNSDKIVTSRREALGLASFAVAGITVAGAAIAGPAAASTMAADPKRPTDAALARAARLYAGEFGGGRGAR